MVRALVLVVSLSLTVTARAGELGEIFWEPGMQPAFAPGSRLFFPGAARYGSAPADAMRVAVFGDALPQPAVSVLSAKVARRDGRVRRQDVIRAIEWAASRGARVAYLRLGFRGTRKEHAELCEAIRRNWSVVFFASAVNIVPPTEVYPANCRLGNLHATWADPRTRPAVQLAPNEVLGPGMARLVLE